jgi:hypothetical protein
LRSASADFVETSKEIKSILKALVRLTYEKPQVRHLFYSILIIDGMVHSHLAGCWEGDRVGSIVTR